ncbi:APC family permease [Pseudomonas turukhanskensis]|uniref:Amino acid permease n=1 Tax=Pseudomonas turukhanskensis TaxID=1806536 RepID=A0A9W6K8Y9_9PSED|nr:APC family permease [Pseudomonas turukhanskensis]GLK90378.1 amino acid permease [Pseudomonas turukhanskensis]
MTQPIDAGPKRHLGVFQALLVTLGMVITTDILKTAPTVALNVGAEHFYWVWVLGGVLSMVGALCFAEMATAFPHPGGDYHFLRRTYGDRVGFLFAWSRFAVLHTGWIALSAFLFGDYFNAVLPLGAHGSALYAGGLIAALVLVNLLGVRVGFATQTVLVSLLTLGFFSIVAAGVWLAWQGVEAPLPAFPAEPEQTGVAGFSAAMIFVFLAFGGWSDAATLSAEVRDGQRGMFIAMLGALTVLLGIYLALNWAFVGGLGFDGLAASAAPAVELLQRAFGSFGVLIILPVVAVAAIASINSTLMVGARTTYAAARDVPSLHRLGTWDDSRGVPRRALVVEGAFALLLVVFGSLANSGFNAMVEYMTPVYWLFLALSSLALILLRRRHPEVPRPIRVPLYPVLPLLFFALCLYMLWSSLAYVGYGAFLGVAVLAVGVVLQLLLSGRRSDGVVEVTP